MGKQSKITITHYLNTNLKPYKINGEDYYPIYLQVTAKRKTTKIRSLMFEEYYTENDFKEIFSFEDEDDRVQVENEITIFENVAKLIIGAIGDFDTTFYAKYINFSNSISIWKPDTECLEYDGKKISTFSKNSIFGFALDTLYLEMTNEVKETTIFEFFNKENQNKAIEYIKSKGVENVEDVLNDINNLMFYASLDYFSYYLEASQKTKDLKELYELLFENYNRIISEKLFKKYGV
ncbi:hypothetical protein ACQ1Q1_00040 [Ornithobacterium rhinotracheale]|uniref:Uncharacterized protein n=1 Tax=Ornithobacterium rhinotracheale (strain ATCC 51463 / DSM 15997 / CCUG 23171 / CIP 104009 / LMG 9086) TaxID=867902 RepID=I3ZY01_ORNRL|nr:hypothetical protein [Ornithobacterium rhinotracheale]AFL96585.1 hypothetical protein Ornrh_0377 [Ornithobacterium rhinotracheale DSM 15997]AIQ00315.1 hypothetical protein Q785_02015 [Ornithobacterium rhinotracheale ORT-UMN 88]KGB67887.1 hypothetical protein Q787_01985 [Ornithobacterium rhinotracheale H06-030791]MCK0194910.1 hypothetical protein [Ornithobacterium rhinotracheale]MCK0203844.1 hypothetical protein [Ornithobacterium rhinotracheale]